jgi:hypothetical protein
MKCLIQLFTSSRDALDMLQNNPLLARQWTLAVEWLKDSASAKSIGDQLLLNTFHGFSIVKAQKKVRIFYLDENPVFFDFLGSY